MASIKDEFHLTKKERKQLERERDAAWDRRIYRRLCALLWLNEGRTQEEVASLLGVADRTVRNWIKLYRRADSIRFADWSIADENVIWTRNNSNNSKAKSKGDVFAVPNRSAAGSKKTLTGIILSAASAIC